MSTVVLESFLLLSVVYKGWLLAAKNSTSGLLRSCIRNWAVFEGGNEFRLANWNSFDLLVLPLLGGGGNCCCGLLFVLLLTLLTRLYDLNLL